MEGKSATASLISSLKQSSHQTIGNASERASQKGADSGTSLSEETKEAHSISVHLKGDSGIPLPELPHQGILLVLVIAAL